MANSTQQPVIAYWFDRTSDADDPRWIVSEERGDHSTTILVLDAGATGDDAEQAAERIAVERGLTVRRD